MVSCQEYLEGRNPITAALYPSLWLLVVESAAGIHELSVAEVQDFAFGSALSIREIKRADRLAGVIAPQDWAAMVGPGGHERCPNKRRYERRVLACSGADQQLVEIDVVLADILC